MPGALVQSAGAAPPRGTRRLPRLPSSSFRCAGLGFGPGFILQPVPLRRGERIRRQSSRRFRQKRCGLPRGTVPGRYDGTTNTGHGACVTASAAVSPWTSR